MKKFSYSILFLFVFIFASLTFPQRQVKADDCGGLVPPKLQKVSAVRGPAAGEVTLYWDKAVHANRYAVAYGTKSGNYIYGADNIGGENSASYTVKGLTPGTKYFFSLAAAHNSCSSPMSVEISAYAAGGSVSAMPSTSYKQQATVKSAPSVVVTPQAKNTQTSAVAGSGTGEVVLSWQPRDSANDYHLMYGTEKGKYQYGALNIGNVHSFTVRHLSPGTRYYFSLVPIFNGQTLPAMPEMTAVASGGYQYAEVVNTTKEALVQPRYDPAANFERERKMMNEQSLPVASPTVAVTVPTNIIDQTSTESPSIPQY